MLMRNPMAKAKMHSTVAVVLEEDWLFQINGIGGTPLEDQIPECEQLMVESDHDLDNQWDDSTQMPPWHQVAAELLQEEEQDVLEDPLPSPFEESWLDWDSCLEPCDLIADDNASIIQGIPECTISLIDGVTESVVDESATSVVEELPLDESDWSESVSNTEQAASIPHDIELERTIDSSQLELLLAGYDSSKGACDDDNSVSDLATCNPEDLEVSAYDESDGDDSDWSYTGDRGRRRPTKKRRINRTEPYQRPSIRSKNTRKKEQNKNAATRYRERKRAEEHDNEVECAKLEKRNRELREKVEAMSHEVTVLRSLIVDIFRGNP